MIARLISATAVAFAMAFAARAAVLEPGAPGAVERVLDSYRAKGVSDGVVLIARNGVPVFRKAFGLANREWGIANTPDTEFRIGSITKQFTALAILQLAEDRKLSLDDPISKFIDGAPPTWRDVTVRHLLTHTSGIPDFAAMPETETWTDRSSEDLVRLVRDRPLEAAPGARFQYDNAGYVLLGAIVRKASGQALGDYLRMHLFTPLGMQHTGFVSNQIVARRASGYTKDGAAWLAAGWLSQVRESGAGALYSTVDDLLVWDQALYDPKRVGLADLKAMFTDYGHGYGFGYVIDTQDGHTRWWHNGHTEGFSSIIARYPADRLTIIILSNDDGARIEPLSHELADAYLKRLQP
jgi:D-alanyl-D-alanine carboxypeptidase